MAVSVIAACRSLALSTWLLSFCFVHLLCLDFTVAEKEEWYTAFVNITYRDPATGDAVTEKTECGRYGEHSPKKDARGLVAMAASPHERQACEPGTRFAVPASGGAAWIALVAKGNCTYKEKIRHAATHNASAVVIFNVGSGSANETITMPHQGTGDIVAIMIPESKGREIAALLERNVTVTMHITIGTRNLQKYVSRTSVVFVSISFIVLMIISLAWLVFYYIQRFRYANARDRNQRRLGDAAKKAISKLQVRTIRKGDKETESDFDNCAVCIEGYKPNDVVRILPCREAEGNAETRPEVRSYWAVGAKVSHPALLWFTEDRYETVVYWGPQHDWFTDCWQARFPQELCGPVASGPPDVSHVQDEHPEGPGNSSQRGLLRRRPARLRDLSRGTALQSGDRSR
ncbi:RING finger protein 150a isoform X2 [Scleropages formosus]|uniref:RING finger protein 150a isoform X2 n=1 Tax=Scleropages formosus TaxID=113540 RepID=UPI0010FAC470|nr:RING finger protein 150 isoform X2 [Scleropages formosus]